MEDEKFNQIEKENLGVILKFLFICQLVAFTGVVITLIFNLKTACYHSILHLILWSACMFLYRKKWFFLAQTLFILTTNYSVFNYSYFFGFDTGWYFYFFTSTLSMFVFLKTENKLLLNISISSYALNFLFLCYWFIFQNNSPVYQLSQEIKTALFVLNFPFAYFLCILLVNYFIKLDKIRALHSSQLLFKKDSIEQENKQLELFNYIVSHNLKGPLSRINGLVSLLNFNDQNNQEILEYIKKSVDNVDQVISDLNLILTNKKKGEDSKEKFNFSDLVNDVKADLKKEIDESLTIFIEDYETSEITSIKSLWYSIVYNLVSNSIKYRSPDRRPEIKISLKKAAEKLIFKCEDNGIGFDQQKHSAKIFELYNRLKPEIPGKGIGLYLVNNHVKHLNGDVKVESELGIGSSFIVSIKDFS
ncbi:MAG: HAMP domain-containing sensor histidine kinase [Cytophagales bacterium]